MALNGNAREDVKSTKPFGLAVSALIGDGTGRYLLLKRSPKCKNFTGQWETPGGKLHPGEAFDAALIREVKEETGLDIVLESAVGVTEFELPKIRVVLLHMWARTHSKDVKLSDEHAEYAWLTLDACGQKDLCPKLANLTDLISRGRRKR